MIDTSWDNLLKYAKQRRLNDLIDKAKARWQAMTPEEREAELHAQKISWARGEAGMGSDADEARDRQAWTARRERDNPNTGRVEVEFVTPSSDQTGLISDAVLRGSCASGGRDGSRPTGKLPSTADVAMTRRLVSLFGAGDHIIQNSRTTSATDLHTVDGAVSEGLATSTGWLQASQETGASARCRIASLTAAGRRARGSLGR